MGCFLSREKGGISIYQQRLEIEAMRKFNERVANYSYPHHGLYLDYIENEREYSKKHFVLFLF
jgi:hypothetical protein